MTREQMKKLMLVMMNETSWNEEEFGEKYQMSWKGYSFELLNELEEEGFIAQFRKSKKVMLRKSGIEKAEKALEEFGLDGLNEKATDQA